MALACSSRSGGNAPGTGGDANFTVNPDGSVTYHNWECEPTQMYTCTGDNACAGAGICQADRHTLSKCQCNTDVPEVDSSMPPAQDSSTPDPDASTPPPPPPPPSDHDLCTNALDQAALSGTFTDPTLGLPIGGILDVIDYCRTSCIIGGTANCFQSCLVQSTGGTVSSTCLGCYSKREQCVTACALPCAIDAATCTACECGQLLGGQNCLDDFDYCTGVATNSCN